VKPGIFRVEIFGQQDEHLTVHGEGEGDRGCWFGEDQVDGIYDAPEKQTWKSGARSIGSRPKNRKILERDMEIGFHITETDTHTYEQNESYLLQAVGWELDPCDEDAKYAKLALTTDISGTRFLDVVQYEESEFGPKIDPMIQQHGNLILKLRSGDPDWYETDFISPFEFSGAEEGFVEVWNPTPRWVLQTWGVTPGVYTFPDYTWRGPKGNRSPGGPDVGRVITTTEILDTDGYTQFNRNREKLPAVNEHDTNITARMNGKFVVNAIPPYTQRQAVPVWKEDAGEGRIELIQPRKWSRPWGGELQS
jgi:hypothetical protein